MTGAELAVRRLGRITLFHALRVPRLARRGALLGYGIPVAAAVGATLTWFSPGGFVAGGDITPFVRDSLAHELFSPWSHQLTGAGSTSYEIARAPEVGAIWLAELLGASEVAGQLLLFAACFGFAAFGTAYLAAALVRSPAAIAVAGLLGAFNSFTLVNHPNPLPLVAGGAIGVLVGMLWRRAQGRHVSPIAFAAATLPASYVAVNPPLVALVAASVAAGAAAAGLFAGRDGARRAFGLLARAIPLVLLLNLWWIVPFAGVALGGAGLDITAETDVSAWSWSHARNSLANVASLNSHWGWIYPEYFPYAEGLERGPWPLLRWLFPAAAVAGVVLAGRRLRALAWAFGIAAVALIFLGKGLHDPLAGVNAWLYGQVPGFWLLREPASKLGTLLVLLYALLAALACQRLLAGLDGRSVAVRRAGVVGLAAVAAGALAYPWPLWSGAVVPADRGILPGSHVRVPGEWRAAAAAVNESSLPGKALVLPLSGFYQVTTSWGYHGADAIPQQLLTRPALQRLPGGYFGNGDGVEVLLAGTEEAIALGEMARAQRLLQALGVSHVVVRRDLLADTQTPTYAPPARLSRSIARVAGARRTFASSVADVFELQHSRGTVRAYSRLVGIGGGELGSSVGGLPVDAVSTKSASTAVDAVRWTVASRRGSSAFRFRRAGTYAIGPTDSGAGLYRVAVVDTAGGAALEFRDTARIAIDAVLPIPSLLFRVPLDSPEVRAVEVGGSLLPLDEGGGFVRLGGQDELQVYGAAAASSVLAPFSGLEDCNAHDERTPEEAGLSLEQGGETVRLAASAHSACTWGPVEWPDTAAAFELSLSYRVAVGAPARVCVWQDGPDRCTPLPTLPEGDGWQTYRTVFRGPSGAKGLRLYLYADGDVRGGSKVEYRDVSLVPLQPASSAIYPADLPRAASADVRLAVGPHELAVTRDLPARPLGPLSRLEDCGASDARTPAEAGLRLRRLSGDWVELGARAHVACAWTSAGTTERGAVYRLSFDHRTLSGRPARVCVWQVGAERCADTPELASGSSWATFAATFRPDPDASELRIYLYADGEESGPPTRVQYRGLSLEPALPATIALERRGDMAPVAPSVRWEEEGPDRFRVQIHRASGPFLLALAESFAPGWSLRGLPQGWTAEHLEVDGYANGWRVQGRGSASLTLEYRPARPVRFAAAVSLGTALACAVFWAVLAVRRRRDGDPMAPRRG